MKNKYPQPRELPQGELLRQFLKMCRAHFAEHSSEIIIGDTQQNELTFIVTPYKRKNYEN